MNIILSLAVIRILLFLFYSFIYYLYFICLFQLGRYTVRTETQLYRLSVHSYVIYAEIELQVDITELLVVMGAKDFLGIENYHYIHT